MKTEQKTRSIHKYSRQVAAKHRNMTRHIRTTLVKVAMGRQER
jgi:hypothetical protein